MIENRKSPDGVYLEISINDDGIINKSLADLGGIMPEVWGDRKDPFTEKDYRSFVAGQGVGCLIGTSLGRYKLTEEVPARQDTQVRKVRYVLESN